MRNGKTLTVGIWMAALVLLMTGVALAAELAPQLPNPGVIDQVTHDRGNIHTTVQNFGYVGGYSWAGYPSGRYPANTNHDYLAEMRFWIGGINSTGDTLLANTADDFNPIPSYIAGNLSHDIRLSTDPERYDYNASDTVGAGIGLPANGWRVWDVNTRDWVYNQVYSPVDSQFHDAGPLGVQESICRYADDATGAPVMNLEITQTIRQWNYDYNKDIIFFTLEIENAGTEDYTNVAFGLYCDYDVGGPDPATGENGRLGDLVDYDADLDLAWTYDEDGYDPGWGPTVVTGFMGTMILGTPGDAGMTSFNTGQWEFLPQTDEERYALIDNTEFDLSLPPTDQYYVQGVRGLNLPAGSSIRIDFAMVAAPNAEYLVTTAQRAKALYEDHYNGPTPPDEPNAKVVAGDGSIMLSWDDTAERSVDWATGEHDFDGYKIYRSTNRGATWGTLVINPDGSLGPDYYPVTVFRMDELGRINRSFVDNDLINGMEYWYSVVAFDAGTEVYDPLQNDRGQAGTVPNTVSITPRDNPLGYKSPQETMVQTYTGSWHPASGGVDVYIVDDALVTGDEYQVAFTEDCLGLYWMLINTTTGDTLLTDQDNVAGYRNTPEIEGIQLVVTNPARVPSDAFQSQFAVPDQNTMMFSVAEQFDPTVGCNEHFRADYEIRFTETGSISYEWFTGAPVNVPFEVWNTTTNTQVGSWFADWAADGEYTIAHEDFIILTDYDYDGGNFHPEVLDECLTWVTALDVSSTPTTGDALTLSGPRLLSPENEFTFSSRKIVASEARSTMDMIRVVPNPYMGYAKWDTGPGGRKLQFANLPDQCTIRVYTLAGELIRTLENDGDGSVDWDMLSEAGRGIAAGVYFYHVDSPYGEKTGKFAVIK